MELCNLLKSDIVLGKRSGYLIVQCGKRNKSREVPLNSTCRNQLKEYLSTISEGYLFPSGGLCSNRTKNSLKHVNYWNNTSKSISTSRVHYLTG
jgi:integrase/recombinase XerD